MLLLKILMRLEEFYRKRAYKCQMHRIKHGQKILEKLNYSWVKLRESTERAENEIKEKIEEVKLYM